LFIVAGSTLYEMSNAEAMTSMGTLPNSAGYISLVNGEGQLAVADEAYLYVLNLDTGAFAGVTSDGWRGSKRVDFLDGYFIFVAPSTEQFYITAADDATALNAADFSSADGQPDLVVTHRVRKRELYLFGTRTCEVWINSGGADFPFTRYQGTPIDVGAVGSRSVCKAADTLVWVGQTEQGGPFVYMLDGYQPVRISTQSVEQQLLTSTDIASVSVWSYQDAGGEFVCINAPGMATTWCWNAATRMWHEMAEQSAGSWVPFRVDQAVYFNGKRYAIAGTKLYELDRRYTDLAGDALVRERTWPHLLSPSLEPIAYHGLEVRCTTGSATAGNLTLEISNDGGSVFGPPFAKSLGAVGARTQRLRWLGLGTCPGGGSRVFRLRCADSVPLTLQGMTLS
jgi:Phage stabilisation protein